MTAMVGEDMLMLYGSLFVGVLLLVEGVYQLVVGARYGPQAQMNRRLRMLEAGGNRKEVLEALRRQRPDSYGLAGRLLLMPQIERLLTQSGSTTTMVRLWLTIVGAVVGVYFVLTFLRLSVGLPALVMALAGGVGLPILWLARRRRRRLHQFGLQLPDAIELIARSLRAGHPLAAAMAVVAQELPDPIGSEFGIAVDEMTYGLELQEAISNISDRVGHQDLHYVVVAVNIQYGTGGNLAEMLIGLAKVIRDREHMFRKARAVSAEGRLSAIFLSVFPLILAGVMWVINPDYYGNVSDEPLFAYFVVGTIVLLISNVLVMRWLVNIRV